MLASARRSPQRRSSAGSPTLVRARSASSRTDALISSVAHEAHMRNAARRFFLRVAHHDLRFRVYISRLFMTSKVRTQPCHIGMSAAWSRWSSDRRSHAACCTSVHTALLPLRSALLRALRPPAPPQRVRARPAVGLSRATSDIYIHNAGARCGAGTVLCRGAGLGAAAARRVLRAAAVGARQGQRRPHRRARAARPRSGGARRVRAVRKAADADG